MRLVAGADRFAELFVKLGPGRTIGFIKEKRNECALSFVLDLYEMNEVGQSTCTVFLTELLNELRRYFFAVAWGKKSRG